MSKPPHADRPLSVDDHYLYWGSPPPYPSARLLWWLKQLDAGWLPNRRIRGMGYDEASEWYGVYIWEYQHWIYPLIQITRKSNAMLETALAGGELTLAQA